MDPTRPIRPGDDLRAALNDLRAGALGLPLSVAAPLTLARSSRGQALGCAREAPFDALLLGEPGTGTSPYPWRRCYRDRSAAGGWALAPESDGGPEAYEENDTPGLAGKRARLVPVGDGTYKFRHLRIGPYGTPPPECTPCHIDPAATLEVAWDYAQRPAPGLPATFLAATAILVPTAGPATVYAPDVAFPEFFRPPDNGAPSVTIPDAFWLSECVETVELLSPRQSTWHRYFFWCYLGHRFLMHAFMSDPRWCDPATFPDTSAARFRNVLDLSGAGASCDPLLLPYGPDEAIDLVQNPHGATVMLAP